MRAKELNDQIHQLNMFVYDMGLAWQGKLITEKRRMFLRTVPYGPVRSAEYDLDKPTMNKISNLLDEELAKKRAELDAMFVNTDGGDAE